MAAIRIAACAMALCSASVILGCDCVPKGSVKHSKKWSEIVFRGTITEIKDGTAFFHVERVWKGKVPRKFTMPALAEGAACVGFWPSYLTTGNDLLVYASRLSKDGEYFTSVCDQTKPSSDAGEDFRKLGKGKPPVD
jgi:uncharacterized membrane protein YjfL (UPF0719 family)